MAFSLFGREEYPRFDGLVSLMRHGRLSHHRSAAVAGELDFLSSELAKGQRAGGVVGAFIDGPTNVDVRGAGLHFDTSRLPEGTLKELAGFVVFDHVRHHILGLPRGAAKVMLLDELRRILLIPGATEFVKELLAQMRKYRCVFIGAFQEPSQIDDIDPALTDLLLGQCKQYFLMRQNNTDQVRRIARVIGLPGAAQRAIVQHPLVEHQCGRAEGIVLHLFLEGNLGPGLRNRPGRGRPGNALRRRVLRRRVRPADEGAWKIRFGLRGRPRRGGSGARMRRAALLSVTIALAGCVIHARARDSRNPGRPGLPAR